MGAIIKKLPYDRVMISFFDPERHVAHSARIVGVEPEIEKWSENLKCPSPIQIPLKEGSCCEGNPFSLKMSKMFGINSIPSINISSSNCKPKRLLRFR